MAGILTQRRREQLELAAAAAALWSLFAVQAWRSFPLLDDWVQRGWIGDRGLDPALVWRVFRYNFDHFNPRIGDVFLLLVNGPRAVHLVVTPAFQLLLLWAAFAVAFGRRPRPCRRDLQLLVVLQALIWLVSPIPGVIYFYRPFATNYLFGCATTLLAIVPYRLALAAPAARARWWAAPAMLALGWLAGMSNEHTGPTAIAVVAGAAIHAARQRRLRAWMVAGALGLAGGYAMLLGAPGQAERYAGRAAKLHALDLVAHRGVTGAYDILAGFAGEAQWALVLVLAAVLGFVHLQRRRGEPLPAVPRAALWAIAGLVAAAGAIVVTLFASPVAVERLLFAPAVLVAGALAVVAEPLFASRRMCTLITGACAAVVVYHAVRFVQVATAAHAEFQQRIARIAAAPPGTVVRVAPYRTPRSRWFWGDDFKMAAVRDHVAHDLHDLAGIEYDDPPSWAEPSPPDHFVARATYDPPLPPALAAAHPPPRHVPPFTEAALAQLHRELALGGWAAIDGHRLIGYQVDAAGAEFGDLTGPTVADPRPAGAAVGVPTPRDPASQIDPRHRPLRVLAWTPSGVTFVDGDGYEDANRQPEFRISAPSLPPGWVDAYVVGCGRTRRVDARPAAAPPHDLVLPLAFECRGSYAAVVCDPDVCWLAARYWR